MYVSKLVMSSMNFDWLIECTNISTTNFSLARHDCVSESLELIKSAQKVVVTDMIFYAALCALSLLLFLASFSGKLLFVCLFICLSVCLSVCLFV